VVCGGHAAFHLLLVGRDSRQLACLLVIDDADCRVWDRKRAAGAEFAEIGPRPSETLKLVWS
jgi:hypothetical protein